MANRRRQQQTSAKIPKPAIVNASSVNSSEASNLEFADVEQQNQYELELSWCIQKLQLGISNEKDQKKAAEAVKYLNKLNGKTVPVIRKRQIMYNLFGDYRAKMKSEEKSQVQPRIHFKENLKLDSLIKSKYLRKSSIKTRIKKPQFEIQKAKKEENDLNEANLSTKMNDLAINIEKSNEEKINYYKMPTGNSNFKFNFNFDTLNE